MKPIEVAPEDADRGDLKVMIHNARKKLSVFTSEGERVPLHNTLRGRSAFLVCNGPSLNDLDLSLLNQRGIVTMGLNNGPAVFKPNYWVSVDSPTHFVEQIWKDSTITKFVPQTHWQRRLRVRDKKQRLVDSSFRVDDCPSVFYYTRNHNFVADRYLTEQTFCWGNSEDVQDAWGYKGGRSVMFVALKMLWYLGANTVYMIGADFKMTEGAEQNYAFKQNRDGSSVRGNNSSYHKINVRLRETQPYFRQAGYTVVNCTPGSGLTAFDTMGYEEAVAKVARECNEKPIITEGMYEQK